MNKEFIPKELAKELMELGFHEPCLAWWFEKGDVSVPTETRSFWSDWNVNPMKISAPLWQQAFRWIAEKHSIFGSIRQIFLGDEYCVEISTTVLDTRIDDKIFKEYYDAQKFLLEYMVDVVKFKIKSEKRKPYPLMSLEELEIELQEVWDKGDRTNEEIDMLIIPLENLIKEKVSHLPKPEITDGDAWWTGRDRIKTFASWQDALVYWEKYNLK